MGIYEKIVQALQGQMQSTPGDAYRLYVQQSRAENPQAPVMTPEQFLAQQQAGQQVPNANQLPIK